jgi:hypothetical protein
MNKQPSLLRFVASILLCLQFFGHCDANLKNLFSFDRSSSNNNNKDEQQRGGERRRLMEVGRGDVHYDAATGTVPHMVSPEVKARESAAQTCDGQMAASLVRANNLATIAEQERDSAIAKHSAAVDAVANLEDTIVQLKAALQKEKLAHEQEVQSAGQLLHETKVGASQSLLDAKDLARTVLDESQQAARREIADLKAEHSRMLTIRKDAAEAELDSLRIEKDDIIASLHTKLTMTSDELQLKLQEEVDKVRADRDSKLASLKAKMEAAVADLEQDRDMKIADLRNKMDRAVAALERDRDTKVSALESKMEDAAVQAARILQTTKEEAKAYVLSQVSAVTDDLVQTKMENESLLKARNEKIKNLEDYAKKMMEQKSDVDHALHEAVLVSFRQSIDLLFGCMFARLLWGIPNPCRIFFSALTL